MHLLAFAGVAFAIIATPGPDTALTIRNTLAGGRACGVSTAAGVACGQAVWALCTAAGIATLLRASQPAFLALRLVGAAYLVYLGARALVDAARGRRTEHSSLRLGRRAWRQGLFSNLSNPKMAVFFVSLLPPFAGVSPSFFELLALGLLFALMTLAWLAGYAVVVARAGDLLRRTRIRRALDAVTGVVLVVVGFRLAAEKP